MVDVYDVILQINIADGQSTEFWNTHSRMKKNVNDLIIFTVHIIVMYKFLERLDLLILDDFLLHTITGEREVKVLFMILEKRCETQKSTIVCSQREPKSWASMILNDEVSANAITKRATKHYTVVINTKNNK